MTRCTTRHILVSEPAIFLRAHAEHSGRAVSDANTPQAVLSLQNPIKMQQTHSDRVRVLTPGHRFIGYVNTKEASRAIFLGLAVKHNANRHRLISVIDLSAKIDVPRQPASLSTTYDEKLVDTYHLQMMKRASGERGSHSFCLWDPWLRFSEARAGRIISEETQRRRMEKKREAAEQSKFAVTGNVHMESWPANPNTAKSNIPVESPWPSGHTVELP